jgi:hypothetical protein
MPFAVRKPAAQAVEGATTLPEPAIAYSTSALLEDAGGVRIKPTLELPDRHKGYVRKIENEQGA